MALLMGEVGKVQGSDEAVFDGRGIVFDPLHQVGVPVLDVGFLNDGLVEVLGHLTAGFVLRPVAQLTISRLPSFIILVSSRQSVLIE